MEFFKLTLPGGLYTHSYYDENNQLKFNPPIYEQRYATALRVLDFWKGDFKKVVDFGCAEMKFIPLLKHVESIEHIIAVDIDKSLLLSNCHRVNPFHSEFLRRRPLPLKIEIYQGSIGTPNDILKNTDAVFALELIEHLYPDVLDNVPYNIFGFMEPKIAIFTTPNRDFNVLFEITNPNGLRHLDHKFEWTRAQFRDWCQNICKRYPKYVVSIFGVGKSPPNSVRVGKVSQFGVFIRKDMVKMEYPLENSLNSLHINENQGSTSTPTSPNAHRTDNNEYHLVHTIDYPHYVDKRTINEKIIDEAKYHINRCRTEKYIKLFEDREYYYISVDEIFEYTKQYSESKDLLISLLKEHSFEVNSNYVIIENDDDGIDDTTDQTFDTEMENLAEIDNDSHQLLDDGTESEIWE